MPSARAALALSTCLWGCARPAPAPVPSALGTAPSLVAPLPDAFRAERPAALESARVDYPTPSTFRLANGLAVYVLARPSPVVAVRIVIAHGAASSERAGLAALTARMLTEGTRRRSSLELAEAVESLGTTLESGADRDGSSVGVDVLPDDVERALALLAEVVSEPAFARADFERVRAEWLDTLKGERQDPQRLAALAAVRALHGPWLGAPVNGTVASVESLRAEDLAAFQRRAYCPDSAALILTGAVDAEALRSRLERLFAGWRGKATVAPPPARTPPSVSTPGLRVLLIDRPDAVQSAIVAVQDFPPRSAAGYEARQVLGRVLGGLFTSRLNQNLREKHAYAYGAFAMPLATRRWGALLVTTAVQTPATAPALREIVRELELIRDPALGAPLTEPELARARADLVSSLGSTLEHPGRMAEQMAELFEHSLPNDYLTRYPATIAAVDAQATTSAAREVLAKPLFVLVVGDRKRIEAELRAAGYGVEAAPPELVE